jgi:nitrile hydratase accessory protein
VFAEPWQAEAFAITLALHEKGCFSWPEWAAALSAALRKAGQSGDQTPYYDCWLAALEALIVAKGVASRNDVDDLALRWQRAAEATPHGQPIVLSNHLLHASKDRHDH